MSIWILTTGNSDVILKHDKNWGSLYGEVRYDLEFTEFASPLPLDPKDKSAGYTIPARVLGFVYKNQPDYFESDLKFPLLDTYCQYFEDNNIKPEKIIILLTDQTQIFKQKQIEKEKCPYWQDTCTLKLLFKWYLQEKFNSQVEFLDIEPTNPDNKGIDNWNETLALVDKTLPKLDDNELTTVYVSHQAGTPAISSAVQFVSLGRFKNVQFLVSNKYFDENSEEKSKSEAIESSNYWRGMQIQKAKQLTIDGLPGAALALLEEINYVENKDVKLRLQTMVNVFNIRDSFTKGNEFNVEDAIQRVVDALALIELFFNKKNYIQGITLLAAAHETFLKAAIVNAIKDKVISVDVNGITKKFKSHQLVQWQQPGLLFIRNTQDKYIDKQLQSVLGISGYFDFEKMIAIKLKILGHLSFPIADFDKQLKKGKIDLINSNNGLFKWLCNLYPKFQPWSLLQWSCVEKDDKKEHEDDIRNQLMHNLLGVNEQQVIKYLLGNPDKITENDVSQVYEQAVKVKFLNEIRSLNFIYKPRNFYEELEAIANDI